MRQPAAIVEDQRDQHTQAVRAALRAFNSSQASEAKASEQARAASESLDSARQKTARARMELGRALVQKRKTFPRSGVNAKGWTEFLEEIGLDPDVADTAMKYAKHIDDDPSLSGASEDEPEERRLPTLREAGLDSRPRASERNAEHVDDDDEPTGKNKPRSSNVLSVPMTEEELREAFDKASPEVRARIIRDGKANLHGASGDKKRGAWCTNDKWARAVGVFDLDPFCNPHAMIAAAKKCMLEDGGDGFGGGQPGAVPGAYIVGASLGYEAERGLATKDTTVFIQPPYDIVLDAIAHYHHTRFCALLRWSPDVEWFQRLWPHVAVVCHPLERIDFKPPPGVPAPDSSIPYPHALYYASADDVTPEVQELCIIQEVNHGRCDPRSMRDVLRLVK